MLSLPELLYYKESYKEYDLIYVVFEDKEFIFRSLTREEYKDIISIIVNDFEFEDAVCQCSIIYPEEFDFSECGYAGLSSKVAPEVVRASNIGNIESILQLYNLEKQILNGFDEQCITLVKAAFPEYSYEEIDTWTWKKLVKFTARAENVMKLRGYDISLINNYNELKEEIDEKMNEITDKEIGEALREQGVDPMDYFAQDFIDNGDDVIEYPVIGTLHWEDEEILNAIRKQMESSYENRKIIKQRKQRL